MATLITNGQRTMLLKDTAESLLIGKVIQLLRDSLLEPDNGRKMSQADLYARCRKLEQAEIAQELRASFDESEAHPEDYGPETERKLEAPKRKGVSFPATTQGPQAALIRDFERGTKPLGSLHRRLIERALGLPNDFLDQKFADESALHSAICALAPARRADAPIVDPAIVASIAKQTPAAAVARRSPNLSPDVSSLPGAFRSDRIIPGRLHYLDSMTSALQPTLPSTSRVLVLQGPPGVGKSYILSQWWSLHGKSIFSSALAIDCSRLTGDRVVRMISSYFLGNSQEAIDGTLINQINSRAASIFIFDGAIAATEPAASADDKDNLKRIRDIISDLIARGANASFVLSIQSMRDAADAASLRGRLSAGINYEVISLPPLSESDGEMFFKSLGVKVVPGDDLRNLSRALGGLPISIVAAAHHLNSLDPLSRENFVTRISTDASQIETFVDFFNRYMGLLKKRDFGNAPHPHAILRLLAMMPGATPKRWLDELLSLNTIKRLYGFLTDDLSRNPVPFVLDFDDRVDVHAFVRSMLRSDLDAIATNVSTDANTDAAELAWIRLQMVKICFRVVNRTRGEMTRTHVDAMQHCVYHLAELSKHLSGREKGVAPVAFLTDEIVARVFSGDASDAELMKFAFERLAKRYLFQADHLVTRSLGRYETKAKILSYFFEDHDVGKRVLALGEDDTRTLLKELGICYLHAGRLSLADKAITRSMPSIRETEQSGQQVESLTLSEWHSWTDDKRRLWIDRVEAISITSLINWRLGRDADLTMDLVRPYADMGRRLASEFTGNITDYRTRSLVRICRRFVARQAQLLFAQGQSDDALQAFELAATIAQIAGERLLTGDTGRRYVEALVRSRSDTNGFLILATRVITDNIEKIQTYEKERRHTQNDIVAWETLRAATLRISGDFDLADKVLRIAKGSEIVKTGECPFAARVELELEAARLAVQCNNGRVVEAELQDLGIRLQNSHHWNYFVDCSLVRAEIVSEDDRRRILTKSEGQLATSGWNMRMQDIFEIRRGGSAITKYGV
jgi:hypothetical protein